MSVLQKWLLANDFSVSKVNCDVNTHLPVKHS